MVKALTSPEPEREEIAFCLDEGFNSSQLMVPNDILWPPPPARQSLGATDVHIWAANLDLPANALAQFASTLSNDERERAARFHFDQHRHRFVAGRGILRSLLAWYLARRPDELKFSYGANGKPALSGQIAGSELNFNLAHSESLALIAVTRLGTIGVDVERVRPVSDANELVERFFSPRENALFQKLAGDEKKIAFFNLWTRKEAWLKATGEGIGHLLAHVEVAFLPSEPARFLSLPEHSASNVNWLVRELKPASDFVGAIALPDLQCSVSHFQYPTSDVP